MAAKTGMVADSFDKPSQCTREVLVEQVLWLIRMRWIAVGAIVAAGLAGSYVFPVLVSAVPIYICAGILLLCNTFYFGWRRKKLLMQGPKTQFWGWFKQK